LSSASSPQAPEMWPLLPSSQVQVQVVQVARQKQRRCRQSPGLKNTVDQMTLHSWLSQQFFSLILCQFHSAVHYEKSIVKTNASI